MPYMFAFRVLWKVGAPHLIITSNFTLVYIKISSCEVAVSEVLVVRNLESDESKKRSILLFLWNDSTLMSGVLWNPSFIEVQLLKEVASAKWLEQLTTYLIIQVRFQPHAKKLDPQVSLVITQKNINLYNQNPTIRKRTPTGLNPALDIIKGFLPIWNWLSQTNFKPPKILIYFLKSPRTIQWVTLTQVQLTISLIKAF